MNTIIQLITRNFILNRRKYLTSYLAISLTLMVIYFIQTAVKGRVEFETMLRIFYVVFSVTGLIFASMAFQELNSPAKSSFYLLLPASHTEKFFAQYILVSVLYTIIGVLTFFVVSTVGSALACLVFDLNFYLNTYIDVPKYEFITSFYISQTVFFAGSLFFKSNAFIKTILSAILFSISFALVMGLFGWMVFGNFNFEFDDDFFFNNIHWLEKGKLMHSILNWFIIGPFFMTVAYFKLTEKEV